MIDRSPQKEMMKISKGEIKSIMNELIAFAGPGKPRGCLICLNGDEKIAQVARDGGYTAARIAEFLIQTRDYPASLMDRESVYRHWYRCEAKRKRQEERRAAKKEAAKG